MLGAVEVPVNPEFKGTWLEHVLTQSRAKIAIVDAEFLGNWTALADWADVEQVLVLGTTDVALEGPKGSKVLEWDPLVEAAAGETVEIIERDAGDTGSVIWTSGTTGRSKGVVIPWGQWWHRIIESRWVPHGLLDESDRLYAPFPVFHVLGREACYRAAAEGSSVVTRRRFSATKWLSDIRDNECTWTNLMSSTIQYVLDQPAKTDDSENPLRFVVMGPFPKDVDSFKSRFGVSDVFGCYGSSEASLIVVSSSYTIDNTTAATCGREDYPGVIKIVDYAGNEVPTGVPGEVLVRDRRAENRMFKEYLNNPEATAEVFKDGWFHTGDLLKRDEEDRLYFTDRKKDALRRGGENISSFEVEEAVLTHPEVAECAAFAVPAASSEDEVMIAVVRESASQLLPSDLHAFIADRLPRFAVPRFIEFVDELPYTPTSKVRKSVLREQGVSDSTWEAPSRVRSA